MVTNWWSRYTLALVLGVSGIAVAVAGSASHLPLVAVAIVAGFLFFAALLSTRTWPSEKPRKKWLFLATGVMFSLGGALGFVQSVQQNWRWTDRLPLAVPLALGVSTIWLVLKFWDKVAL